MKKALQGFWRGSLLGGLLGWLGGWVFRVGCFYNIYEVRECSPFLFEYTYEILPGFVEMFVSAIPGLLIGSMIGGILGAFSIYLFDDYSALKRIVLSVMGCFVLYVLVGAVFYILYGQGIFSKNPHYVKFLIWPISLIYLIAAILFGYYFPIFKPRLKNMPPILWILVVFIPLLYLIFSFFYYEIFGAYDGWICSDFKFNSGDFFYYDVYIEDGRKLVDFLAGTQYFFSLIFYLPGLLILFAGYLFFERKKPKFLTRFLYGFSILYVLAYLATTHGIHVLSLIVCFD